MRTPVLNVLQKLAFYNRYGLLVQFCPCNRMGKFFQFPIKIKSIFTEIFKSFDQVLNQLSDVSFFHLNDFFFRYFFKCSGTDCLVGVKQVGVLIILVIKFSKCQ